METNPKPQIVSTTGNAIKEEALKTFEASLLGEVIHPSEDATSSPVDFGMGCSIRDAPE